MARNCRRRSVPSNFTVPMSSVPCKGLKSVARVRSSRAAPRAEQKQRREQAKWDKYSESDEISAFVAGYTPWGFPYATDTSVSGQILNLN